MAAVGPDGGERRAPDRHAAQPDLRLRADDPRGEGAALARDAPAGDRAGADRQGHRRSCGRCSTTRAGRRRRRRPTSASCVRRVCDVARPKLEAPGVRLELSVAPVPPVMADARAARAGAAEPGDQRPRRDAARRRDGDHRRAAPAGAACASRSRTPASGSTPDLLPRDLRAVGDDEGGRARHRARPEHHARRGGRPRRHDRREERGGRRARCSRWSCRRAGRCRRCRRAECESPNRQVVDSPNRKTS